MIYKTLYIIGVLCLDCALLASGRSVHSDAKKLRNHYEVLNVTRDCTLSEIKKAYRHLALELHPDKFRKSSKFGHLDLDAAKTFFLEVQNAYSVLGAHDRRKQYDLQLSGIEYENYVEAEADSRYMKAASTFRTFIKTPSYRMFFETSFPQESIPMITVELKVSIKDSLFGLQNRRHVFHRREICGSCNGTGTKNGQVVLCKFCQGLGQANHLYSHPSGNFEQMTNTICGMCHGLGFTPQEKCDVCGGKGMNIGENYFIVSIPPGFRSGYSLVINGAGHMSSDARIGSVHVTVKIDLPEGWEIVSNASQDTLHYTMKMSIYDILAGFERDIYSPSGEVVHVRQSPVTKQLEDTPCSTCDDSALDILTLIQGIHSEYEYMGMLNSNSERGMLKVRILCDFLEEDAKGFFLLLEDAGILKPLPGNFSENITESIEEIADKQKGLQDRLRLMQHLQLLLMEEKRTDPTLVELMNTYNAFVIQNEILRAVSEGTDGSREHVDGLDLEDFNFNIAPDDIQFAPASSI